MEKRKKTRKAQKKKKEGKKGRKKGRIWNEGKDKDKRISSERTYFIQFDIDRWLDIFMPYLIDVRAARIVRYQIKCKCVYMYIDNN